ncbi:MAG: CDP-alcohol phosphatidyltransferase family protein [Methyloprofundus sp.]|nr:CDP-alcohol phosphatidyltransferase family protein [Methyloprofundus sp.]MDT8425020.1 CDP-alcohol phosphatidyltransferase family protein [Methyloprofundus sp.]
MPTHSLQKLLTLPNLLTCFRFVSAPFLLWLAFQGAENAFLILLAFTFLSDVLDGIAARLLKQESDLGALLDSWADLLIYTIIAISAWQMKPHLMQQELFFAVITVISYLLPVLVGIIKFRTFTSYHTWLVKVAAATMGTSLFILLLFNIALPFRVASFICLAAAIEEILITFYLTTPQFNVRSLWHIKKKHEGTL